MTYTFDNIYTTPEHTLLRDQVAKFISREVEPYAQAWEEEGMVPREVLRKMGQAGLLGLMYDPELGGGGADAMANLVFAEALSQSTFAGFIITVLVHTDMASPHLHHAGTAAQKAKYMPRITTGECITAVGVSEPGAGSDVAGIRTTAKRDGGHWVLNGTKAVVVSAPLATHLLIVARTGKSTDEQALSLFLTEFDPGAPPAGLTMHGYRTIDDRRAADLIFDDYRLPADALLQIDAGPSLALARDEGAAAVCAEAVGAMRKVLADTVEYSKQRQQFGQPIGNFQVLQHRMVDMYMELQQAVSAAYLAVLNLDAEPDVRARAVSAAKATVGRAARFVGQNAVQLHGGMGMTEELAIGHYFKRLTALQYEFGSTDYHRARYAKLTKPTT